MLVLGLLLLGLLLGGAIGWAVVRIRGEAATRVARSGSAAVAKLRPGPALYGGVEAESRSSSNAMRTLTSSTSSGRRCSRLLTVDVSESA